MQVAQAPKAVHNRKVDHTITIGERDFTLVREQRSGLSLYRSPDAYLRIGAPERLAREIETHQKMEAAHFPVPQLLATGTHGEYAYLIERALGDKTFRVLFEESIQSNSAISHELFEQFLAIVRRYLVAQASARVDADRDRFARGVHLDLIVQELPEYAYSLPDKFNRVLKKLAAYPFVLSHGDFNAANIFPNGVIDLEDSFPAPFGFDAISALSTLDWFPDSAEYEYFARYRFSAEQRAAYLAMCDAVAAEAGYPPPSLHADDFGFCRAIWSCVRMQAWPKLRGWRYDKFIRTYLYI